MNASTKNPALAKSEVIDTLPRACADELAAVEFFEAQRWGDCPACVHCGSTDVYKMTDAKTGGRSARFLWRCNDCKKQYTVRIGTVYEESRIPLRHWCYAFWRASTSKKGVSALEIMRQCQISYKSALFLMHRIRFAMAPDHATAPKLTGTVEADETHVGGKPRYRAARIPGQGSPNAKSMKHRHTPVFAAVQRNGDARVRVIPDVTGATLREAVREHVEKSARLMTDELPAYLQVGAEQEGGHCQIQHKAYIYANGDITTNTVESFFALLKRGIHGIYHNVSRKHLHRYLAEFEFRYNARQMNDGERTVLAVKKAEGKRLMFREPTQPML
jgi:transposase-like protein